MNNLGEVLILSRSQKVKIIESLRGCKGCYFHSDSKGCRKSFYLSESHKCNKEDRDDNKNIIYKRIK